MTTTTPLELIQLGKVPPRDGDFSTRTTCCAVELIPGLFLIATIHRAKNRCILELSKPVSTSSGETSRLLPQTHENARQSHSPVPSESLVEHETDVSILAVLRSGFRVPRIIQLVAEDEGVIETVSLIREPLDETLDDALANRDDNAAGRRTAARGSPRSISSVHVHFFIGTSNGTVLIGNALRGTIVAVAQFQHHHRFDDDRRGERLTTTSTSYTGESSGSVAEHGTMSAPSRPVNQGVVKFVVRQRSDALLWNPSLPLSHRCNGTFLNRVPEGGLSTKTPTTQASPTVLSSIESVYVVHSGGIVVELPRVALDVFVRTSIDRLDGQRPHLILEWSPDNSTTLFPVAGPASGFAAYVTSVSLLASRSVSYSAVESGTASTNAAKPTDFSLCDADIFSEASDESTSRLLSPLRERGGLSAALLVGGSNPLLSSFSLQHPSSELSASSKLKALKNVVSGVARSLWFSALGTSWASEPSKHLKEVTAPCLNRFLQPGAKCTRVQVDPTQQWAAFVIEGGGRIYVVDVQSGLVTVVLKGCRAAQFTWWWTELAGGRSALLLVVYLPLRRAVEVYTVRSWQRLAARHVPEGSVLLRFSGVPRENMNRTYETQTQSRPKAAFDGNGSAPLLMDPSGNVFRISIQWVLGNPMASHARLRSLQAASPTLDAETEPSSTEGSALSRSTLRACQTPDDFLELALNLPLPRPRVQQSNAPQKGFTVAGTDKVRTYLAQLTMLCETVQCRFAPGYAEIAVTPIPCPPRDIFDGAVTAMPRGMTAAQCIHYVQLYASLVENYQRLLTCKAVAATRYFDPQLWTSPLVTSELWKATFCTTTYPVVSTFVKNVDVHVVAALATYPTEQNIYKRLVSAYLQRRMRDSPRLSTAAERARAQSPTPALEATKAPPYFCKPSEFISLSTFLRCFYVGSARPILLRDTIESIEDADGSVTIFGPLSDLVFGVWGIDSFLRQLPALRDIGLTEKDIAHITLTWVARQASRDFAALLSSTTVGCLSATLLSFPDEHFTAALARAPIPFVSVDGGLAKRAAVDCVTGLLWCCAVRLVLRRPTSFAQSELLLRRVRQLLQLWHSLSKGLPPSNISEPTETGSGNTHTSVCHPAVAFFLRLSGVEPSKGMSGQFDSVACSSGELSSTVDGGGARREGDVMEVYLQKNGISITLLDGFKVPRADADADATRFYSQFIAFMSLLREEGFTSYSDAVASESLPWIEKKQWDARRFRSEVLQSIERLWDEVHSTFTTVGTKASVCGGSVCSVYESCLLLVTAEVLEHVLRPITEVTFFFWETNTVPDGNFFPVDGTSSGLMLSSSRASRGYLKSVLQLASLLEKMILRVLPLLDHAERALLIQKISLALAADDKLLFPLVPNFMRMRLTMWMQVIAETPRAPLRRAKRVQRLVELILFFSDVSSSTAGGVPLTQLQSHLTVPWKDLLCGPNRRVQLQVLPNVTFAGDAQQISNPIGCGTTAQAGHLTDSASSLYAAEEMDMCSAPLNIEVAAKVLRRFLAAASVLCSNHHARAEVTLGSRPCLGIVAEDTREVLTRLAVCLGLQEHQTDIANVVLMDYEIKHLFPIAAVEQEMLLLSTKSAVPQVAASILQSFLVILVQHVIALRKRSRQCGDRGGDEAASEQLHIMTNALSQQLRAWLQACEKKVESAATGESTGMPDTTDGRDKTCVTPRPSYTTPAESIFSAPGWVTPVEHREMSQLVSSVLLTKRGSAAYKNFFNLLFTLSQWVCEGSGQLPAAAQQVARELPFVVEMWEKVL